MYRHSARFLALTDDQKQLFNETYEASYFLCEFHKEHGAPYHYCQQKFEDKDLVGEEVAARNSYHHYMNCWVLGQIRKCNC